MYFKFLVIPVLILNVLGGCSQMDEKRSSDNNTDDGISR